MQNGLQKSERESGREEVRRRLAGRIAAIENRQPRIGSEAGGFSSARHSGRRIALGIEEIDRALDPRHGKGLEFAGLHEIRSSTTLSFAAAAGFALVLGNHLERSRHLERNRLQPIAGFQSLKAGQTCEDQQCEEEQQCEIEQSRQPHPREVLSLPLRPIFWISNRFCQVEAGDFYGPGLYPLGIDPGRLVRVLPHNFGEAIWAAGEVSRTDKIGFALLEVRGNPRKLDLTVTRQLLLRCQANLVPFFILRQAGMAQTSAVSTRWLVEPALSQDLGHRFGRNSGGQNSKRGADNSSFVGMTTWNVSLEKCRGGKIGNWTLEWNHHEQAFKIAGQFSGRKSNHANQYQSAGYQKQQYEGKPVQKFA